MRQILTLTILWTILAACGPETSINYGDSIGLYTLGVDTTNYTDLTLRADSTYYLNQDPLWQDSIFEYLGKWTVTNDTIILFLGKDFTNKISIERTTDTKSDSLLINVQKLLDVLGQKTGFSINGADLEVINGQIKMNKKDHWGDSEFNGDYGYVTLPLDIRLQNGYARIQGIFAEKQITLFFDKLTSINLATDTILCKYFKLDSVLYSTGEYEVLKNDLVKNRWH